MVLAGARGRNGPRGSGATLLDVDSNAMNRTGRSDHEAERVGLGAAERYRCAACGNVTRFDVEVTERARWYWHADLSGRGTIDGQERETTVHRVSCRWCGGEDVVVEARPATST